MAGCTLAERFWFQLNLAYACDCACPDKGKQRAAHLLEANNVGMHGAQPQVAYLAVRILDQLVAPW